MSKPTTPKATARGASRPRVGRTPKPAELATKSLTLRVMPDLHDWFAGPVARELRVAYAAESVRLLLELTRNVFNVSGRFVAELDDERRNLKLGWFDYVNHVLTERAVALSAARKGAALRPKDPKDVW